jgi:copper chaperone CopZ
MDSLKKFCFLLLLSLNSFAKTPTVSLGEVKIKVKGVVCSFCAYGIEKKISKLDFLDKTKFDSDGVKIDIKQQIVSVAIKKDKKANLQNILTAIVKGGYEVVEFYLNISGEIKKSQDKYILTSSDKSRSVELKEKNLDYLLAQKNITLSVAVTAKNIPNFDKGVVTVAKFIEAK